MSAQVVCLQMIMMLLLMGAGFASSKAGYIKGDGKQMLSKLVVNVFNPALLVYSISSNDSAEARSYALITFAAGAVMYVFLIVSAHILAKFASKDREVQNVRHLMYIFANTSFIGIPVVRAVLGEEYLVYIAIINLEFCMLFYTYGQLQVQEEGEKFSLGTLKQMLSVGTIASVVGLFIFFTRIRPPQLLLQACYYLGNATTPLAMMILGVTMAEEENISAIFKNVRIYPFCIVRMLVIPLIACFLLKLSPLPEEIRQVILFMVAVPVANMPLMLLLDRGKDTRDCSDGILLTTMMAAVTIPMIVLVYLHI